MQLWFLDTLVAIPVPRESGVDGISVLESLAARGDSPPLHVHRDEDEIFHLVEGELTLVVGDRSVLLRAGDTALAPQGVPHTYRVESERARWLVVTANGSFESFVRAASRPAQRPQLPEPSGPPTPERQRALSELAARHGIDLVGPPLAAQTVTFTTPSSTRTS